MEIFTFFVSLIITFLVIVKINKSQYKLKNSSINSSNKPQKTLVSFEIGVSNLNRFFVECVLADCSDFSSEKSIARAKALADKYSLAYPDGIQALYSKGLESYKAYTNYTEDKKANEALTEQRKKRRHNLRFKKDMQLIMEEIKKSLS